MSHGERLKEIKSELAKAKPDLQKIKMWGKEHDAMEYMVDRIEHLTEGLEWIRDNSLFKLTEIAARKTLQGQK